MITFVEQLRIGNFVADSPLGHTAGSWEYQTLLTSTYKLQRTVETPQFVLGCSQTPGFSLG